MILPEVIKMDNGIVRITYPAKSHLTLALVKAGFEQVLELVDEPCLLMVVGRGIRYADYDALTFTNTPVVTEMVKAQALITRTFIERVLGDMYVKTHPTPYPNRCFTDSSKAEEWLLRVSGDKVSTNIDQIKSRHKL